MKVILRKNLSLFGLCLLSLLYNTSHAQSLNSDSLKVLYDEAKEIKDATKLLEIADTQLELNPSVSMKIAKQTAKYAMQWENAELAIQSNLVLGKAYNKYDRYVDGSVYLLKAEMDAITLDNNDLKFDVLVELGDYYSEYELHTDAYKNYLEAYYLNLNQEIVLSKLVNTCNLLKNYTKAIVYANEGVSLSQQSNNNEQLIKYYLLLAEAYYGKSDSTSALSYYQSADLLLKSSNQIEQSGFVQIEIARLIYSKDATIAKQILRSTYQNAILNNQQELLFNSANLLASYLIKEDQLSSTEALLEEILPYVSGELKAFHLPYLKTLSHLFFLSDQKSKGFEILRKYSGLQSKHDQQQLLEIKQLSITQKDILIAKQQFQGAIRNASNSQNVVYSNYVIYVLIVCVLGILFLIYLIAKQKSKAQERLIKEQLALKEANIQLKDFKDQLKVGISEQTKDLEDELAKRTAMDVDLKKALKKAEDANYLKNAFLSNMSHEIRTPLNGIIGFSNLLLTELSLMENQELYEYASGIQQSGDRLLNLLNNIIDISRIEANDLEVKLTSCDINEILLKVSELFKFKSNERGIKFNLKLNEIPHAQADPNSLTKILSDIIDNAVKYTEKGFINVVSEFDPVKKQNIISIKDTGIGIDQSYLDHIFEAFRQESLGYSRNYQGAGLGLPLAKRLTSLMQGEITVDSEKGKGTTVRIYLKTEVLSAEEKESVKVVSLEDRVDDEKIKIFIVEDDRMNRLVLQKMLANIGVNSIAEDGEESLQIIETAYKKGEFFDVMLFDINLPAPWDGIKLMHEIKERWSEYKYIPFIAQTAYAMKGDKERLMEAGFDNYIPKPVNKKELINMLFNQIEMQKKNSKHNI